MSFYKHRILFALFAVLCAVPWQAVWAAPNTLSAAPIVREAPIRFWNRTIALQRGVLAGADPELRAQRASERLAELPLSASGNDLEKRSIKIEDQEGVGFIYQGRLLFFLGTGDLDKESGERLDQAADSAIANLTEALKARTAERSWPVIRNGVLYTVSGFVLLVALCVLIWKVQSAVAKFVRKREGLVSLKLARVDIVPHIAGTGYALFRLVAWGLTLFLVYLWVALSLRRFPYTEPWGLRANGYIFHVIRELAENVLAGLPNVLVVIVIIVFVRWMIRMTTLLLDQVARGTAAVPWMDADVAKATQRIVSAVLWIFGIIVAYPYIPGSQTEAFKGLSVFFGLVVSLGSTGIINQIISGLFVVYSKALKTGEWVKVNDTEGEVLDVGLLAAKVLTVEGQEVTVPNSILVSTSTVNHTRLGHPDGKMVNCTVTIGYDAPWRQVHALLELAAGRTSNILKTPKPHVLQRQLSDFYIQYTLVARLDNEAQRVQTVSDLHAAIQDAFNEFGVQIMSPHFMMQPNGSVVVPREKWDLPPAGAPTERSEAPDRRLIG